MIMEKIRQNNLGGGFKHLLFSPLPGDMIQFHKYFSNGLKPPTDPMILDGRIENLKLSALERGITWQLGGKYLSAAS